MKPLLRHLVFVFAAGLAGLLSGGLSPLYLGVRGVILGATLAFGVIALNPWRPQRLPWPATSLRYTLAVAFAVSVVAFALMVLWQANLHRIVALPPRHDELGVLDFDATAAYLTCLAYAATLLTGYRIRHLGGSPGYVWFGLAPIVGALGRSFKGWDGGFGTAVLATLVFGALPFVFLWLLAVRLADPAWTRERWFATQRLAEPDAKLPH